MDPQYWLARWQRHEIGFHQREYNPHLLRLWPELGVPAGASVFVPLAGKSADLAWLHGQGFEVIGVEISPLAVSAFFAETGWVAHASQQGAFDRIASPRLALLIGDYFALTPADVPGVAAVWDRGSLVAFPPAMRAEYARHMARLLAAGAVILLVTVDYDETLASGPPFAVGQQEVHRLFQESFDIELLHEEDVSPVSAKFRNSGMRWLLERVFRLTRRPC